MAEMNVGPLLVARCVLSAVFAVGWLCAIWRLAVGEGGPLEASVTAGGWGLSLLPVSVTRAPGSRTGVGAPRGPVRGTHPR
ncbi:hypothetical protein KDA82_24300, partial [Streptomyces daliensis]|nr:hypothetical protein [Streptomyces daliensis]